MSTAQWVLCHIAAAAALLLYFAPPAAHDDSRRQAGEKTVPTYEYRCEANGRLVEVRHKMAERVATWGELCERAGIPAGQTDPGAPVEKLISAGFINAGTSASEPACEAPGCGNGFCGTGACGIGE
jgi:hypothetical protein